VTKKVHERAWEEFPKSWFEGIEIHKQVASDVYNPAANRYRVRSGKTTGKKDSFGLQAWQESGWIVEQDPFGWFQWYCRFYLGRRSEDDDRQIGRWAAMCGAKGRWKRNLIARCVREGKAFDDVSCAPVVRQTLQHWAYRLSEADFLSYKAEIAGGARTAFIPAASMPHVDPPQQPSVVETGSIEHSQGPADNTISQTTLSSPPSFEARKRVAAHPPGKGSKKKSTGKSRAVQQTDTPTGPSPTPAAQKHPRH
jgi:hypothetical protein